MPEHAKCCFCPVWVIIIFPVCKDVLQITQSGKLFTRMLFIIPYVKVRSLNIQNLIVLSNILAKKYSQITFLIVHRMRAQRNNTMIRNSIKTKRYNGLVNVKQDRS